MKTPLSMIVFACLLASPVSRSLAADPEADEAGFISLFNGEDLTGWVVPEGDNGHWKVVDGVIDYDAQSEAQGDKNLWTEKEYGDFVLKIDWRIKQTTGLYEMPIVLPDGTHLTDAQGKEIKIKLPNADSGIYVRGSSKSQLNIWCWPIGSGEVYGYRMDKSMPPEVRAGVTPRVNADNPVGEWNQFIIVMSGDRLTVILNNRMVLLNAQLPGVPETGRIALQHHGGLQKDGKFSPASALMQFRNISIKELPPATAAPQTAPAKTQAAGSDAQPAKEAPSEDAAKTQAATGDAGKPSASKTAPEATPESTKTPKSDAASETQRTDGKQKCC